ncbi:MAG: translation initiation factor IF-2 [Candidatus Aenigmatarchaeota archaeon]
MLRQPIIVVLGHIDHGKTTLLDKIRQTAIATKEAGGITQAIGTTEIPINIIKKLCSYLIKKFNFEITIPGLLFIDTPGHEAFTTLRKRGGSIADIAILVIDINEGIMPQTKECLDILKFSKTPFVIAVNKIDKIHGWVSHEDLCFIEDFPQQSESAKSILEEKFYKIIQEISKLGFNAERFDRISDFRKTIAAVPISAKTGEGISDLLVILTGLAQQFLKDQLITTEKSEGMILEVKESIGLGTTIDAIIYDGSISKNDFLVIGGKTPMITKIKALFVPEPLRDMRTEKKFKSVESVNAACGVKIAAPGLDGVVAGSPIRTTKTMEHAKKLLEELEKEREEVEISTDNEGLILKADTTGSIEALIHIFGKYPIKEAKIGQITKTDVIKIESNVDPFLKVIVGFNVMPTEEAELLAKNKGVKILHSNVIYHLIEDYEKWVEDEKENIKRREIESLTRPGKIKILPGCIFRASNPAIIGCEVFGVIKPGYTLFKYDNEFKIIGTIKQIQSQGQNIDMAKTGDKVAVSIPETTVGRQVFENDILYTNVESDEYIKLKKNENLISSSEKEVLNEIFEIKKIVDPRYGLK